MMIEERPPQDPLENWIGDHLRDQERSVDAARILAGVRARLINEKQRPPRHAVRTAARWGTVAAALFLMLGFGWTFRRASAHADAVKLVREARDILDSRPTDRTYRIEIALAQGVAERSPFLAAISALEWRLWTRQDRLWIEGKNASQVWAYGRDENRHVWVAATPEVGLDFGPDDVPEQLDEALDLLNFDLKTIFNQLATDFDVTLLESDGHREKSGMMRILGKPKAGHPRPRIRAVTVEIDEVSKIVRQVVVSRVREGRALAEVSYDFEGAETQPDSSYRLESHLEPFATTFGPDRRLRRRRELVRFFGSLLLKSE